MIQNTNNVPLVPEVDSASEEINKFCQSPVYCPKCKRHLNEGEWELRDSTALFCSPICKHCGSRCAVYQEISMTL